MKRAATYRKSHKSLSMAEAVKKVAAMDRAGKKPAHKKAAHKKAATKKAAPKKHAVGKVHRKKAAPKKKAATTAAPRKIKIKLKPAKKATVNLGISGLSHQKMGHELQHIKALTTSMDRHKGLLKTKGLTATEKAAIRRDIVKYRNNIAAAKKHISALKRSI